MPGQLDLVIESGGDRYVAQRAERLDTGEVRVYHILKGDWARVDHIQRDQEDEILST